MEDEIWWYDRHTPWEIIVELVKNKIKQFSEEKEMFFSIEESGLALLVFDGSEW